MRLVEVTLFLTNPYYQKLKHPNFLEIMQCQAGNNDFLYNNITMLNPLTAPTKQALCDKPELKVCFGCTILRILGFFCEHNLGDRKDDISKILNYL